MKSGVELLAGFAFLVFPASAVSLLFGLRLTEPAGAFTGRIVGVALLTLGISCGLAHKGSQERAAIGLIVALLFYDVSFVLILLYAHFRIGFLGIFLWPAVALHSGLGVWSLLCLGREKQWAALR